LANAANSQAVDDIYVFSNFKQPNVVPSAPHPFGPQNADPDYTPLWQVSSVTWNPGSQPRVLTSEAAIRDAASNNELTISKTDIVLNCPILGSSAPTAAILNFDIDRGSAPVPPHGPLAPR
jgi:hypothetical protein